jgi:hypothetical protein
VSTLEDQVRAAFEELADEARPAPLVQRLEQRSRTGRARLRTAVAVAASIAALALAAASLILLRVDDRPVLQPTVAPPKVLRLADIELADPGPATMLVVLADVTSPNRFLHEKPAYLVPVKGGPAVLLEESDTISTWTEHLSQDGTSVIRQTEAIHGSTDSVEAPGLEIVDLRTGAIDDLHGAEGVCPALSPDNSAVAAFGETDTWIIDVATGRLTMLNANPTGADSQHCGAFAWSPDGTRLVVPGAAASRVVDPSGRTLGRLPGLSAVNASMSWSPDGRTILLYDKAQGRFVTREVDSGSQTTLTVPAGAIKPMGWAGDRIVWLTGEVGKQSLVTTDDRGSGPRLWTRLETRGMPIESVSWSAALRGAARG